MVHFCSVSVEALFDQCCSNSEKGCLENIPWSQKKEPVKIEIDHLIDFFFSFCETHGRFLSISTIKHQTSNTKPTDLCRGAYTGQNEKACPLQKDKSRMEGPAGLLQLLAYY